jgi:hypothetical protein
VPPLGLHSLVKQPFDLLQSPVEAVPALQPGTLLPQPPGHVVEATRAPDTLPEQLLQRGSG